MTDNPQVYPPTRLGPDLGAEGMQAVVHAALAYSAAIEDSTVGVTSDDKGFITLRGLVGSWPERTQAERVCQRTVGVTGVDNQIRIRPAPGHDFRDRP